MRITLTLIVLSVVLGGCSAPRLSGTYVLRWRDMPDGAKLMPPAIGGCMTCEDGLRNFNVYWDQDGETASISAISEYELTKDSFSETNFFYLMQLPGYTPIYDRESTTGTAPVIRSARSMQIPLPLHDEPTLDITSDGFTATRLGEFVDHWERIR